MVDILLPVHVRVARARFKYIDSSGVSRAEFTGVARVAEKGGDRLGASLDFTPHGGITADGRYERGALGAFLLRMRGKINRPYLFDHAYRLRGSFPTGELLANNAFTAGTSGWTSSNGAHVALASADRVLRATRLDVGSDQTIRATAATTVNGATYAARVFAYAGRGAMDYRLRLGSTAGGSEVSADGADYTSGGLRTLTGVAAGTTTHFSILDGVSGRSIGGFQDFEYCSLSRCALVNGGSQTGSALNVDALPASTTGLLLLFDQFEVITSAGSELKFVTAPLDSNASGQGYLQFSPPLRGTPVDNAPIIIHQPMSRFRYLGDFPEWLNEPGTIMTTSLDGFEEQ